MERGFSLICLITFQACKTYYPAMTKYLMSIYGTNQHGQGRPWIHNCQSFGVPRRVFVESSPCCPRWQTAAAVKNHRSYNVTPPRCLGESIPGRGWRREIEFWGSFEAQLHIFTVYKTIIFIIDIQIALTFLFWKHTLISTQTFMGFG